MDRLIFLLFYNNTKIIYNYYIQIRLFLLIIEVKLVHLNNNKRDIRNIRYEYVVHLGNIVL